MRFFVFMFGVVVVFSIAACKMNPPKVVDAGVVVAVDASVIPDASECSILDLANSAKD